MPAPRKLQVCVDATPYYHCISRCVRRAFLCGHDRLSHRNFDHRKGWLVDRILELSAVFAIDVCAYAVLSNHFHLVIRIDRERALSWSDDEVTGRMAALFPRAVEEAARLPAAGRRDYIARWRERLWNLSWYMRCLNESIARRANQEDGCRGRFWEGRFKSQALLDVGALLACMAYVDLNPIRAGVADSLEASDFTSIQERLRAAPRPSAGEELAAAELPAGNERAGARAALLPFADEAGGPRRGVARDGYDAATPPWLPVERADYVELLGCTGELVGAGASGPLPPRSVRALKALGLDPPGFVSSVREFSRSFFSMVGEVHHITLECQRRGYRRRLGLQAARRLYRPLAA